MIISHEHNYLFIEIPLTGSWSIRNELVKHYNGTPVLHKHATFQEWQRGKESRGDLFVFATVRNPLDKTVSRYFKLNTDHKGAFSDPDSAAASLTDFSDLRRYRFIMDHDVSFEKYFSRYCRRQYSDMIDLAHSHLDFAIRFESLQEGFADVAKTLGLRLIRPIPLSNPTQGRSAEWQTYYAPGIRDQAKRVCGPFMQRWGYDFPSEWGEGEIGWRDQAEYQFLGALRMVYLTRFRYSDSPIARLVRKLRAVLVR